MASRRPLAKPVKVRHCDEIEERETKNAEFLITLHERLAKHFEKYNN